MIDKAKRIGERLLYTTYLVVALIVMTSLLNSCKTIEVIKEVKSTTGCCSYILYDDGCLEYYESDGYHRTYCGDQQVLEQSIEEIEENCYDNHF